MDVKSGINELKNIIGSSAPLLSSVLGSNYYGIAISLLAKFFGSKENISDIIGKINSTKDVSIRLKEIENQHCEVLKKLTAEDRKSFRDWMQSLIADPNVFKGGWIPLAGWSAGFLFMLYYFPQLIILTYVWGKNCISTGVITPFPMKPDEILNLVYVMFGFGTHHIINKFTSK